jgi:HEAT repeat protein
MPREAFIKIGRDAVPTLIKLLYIPDSRINGSAEWALAKIKDERAIEHLARIIDDIVINPAPISRATTVWAIGEIGGKKAAEVLKQLLKRKDEHPSVIGEALEGLGKIGDTSAEDLILPLLSHSNKKIRYHAANALKTCGTQKSVPFLLQCFETETNHAVKVAIAHALKALGISVEVKSMSLNEK